jgi:hypothetical protein
MYRQIDLDILRKNIDNIKDEAMMKKLDTLEPTMKEFNEVYDVILDYIKKKRRIIYGGFAQNHLIEIKNKYDSFYKDLDLADVEFYSFEPLTDVVEMCDLLHSKGYKYVQGSEGAHPETYKIFVNFINYCDISYMPKNVHDNMPYIDSKGLRFANPHFMLVDAFRVYSDPLTSYFRLDKTFNRFSVLMRYYPFDEKLSKNKIIYDTKISNEQLEEIKHFVRHEILHHSQFIIVGHYAYNYLVKKANLGLEFENFNYYQAISINYLEDRNNVEKHLKEKYKNDITVKHFVPFFQFLDSRTEYFYKDVCILKLYGHNNRCIVNNFSEKKKVFFGTFQLIFLYLLADYQFAIIRRDQREQNNFMIMITRLLAAREKYLDSHDLTILDKSPFQEFTLQCLGSTQDPLRQSRIDQRKRKDEGKMIVFRYDPTGKPGKVPEFRFNNTSGNEIMNKKK